MVLAQERTCSCVTEPELILMRLPRPMALLQEQARQVGCNVLFFVFFIAFFVAFFDDCGNGRIG
eukprot:9994184-Ditylum_brightwellii.AAC.1